MPQWNANPSLHCRFMSFFFQNRISATNCIFVSTDPNFKSVNFLWCKNERERERGVRMPEILINYLINILLVYTTTRFNRVNSSNLNVMIIFVRGESKTNHFYMRFSLACNLPSFSNPRLSRRPSASSQHDFLARFQRQNANQGRSCARSSALLPLDLPRAPESRLGAAWRRQIGTTCPSHGMLGSSSMSFIGQSYHGFRAREILIGRWGTWATPTTSLIGWIFIFFCSHYWLDTAVDVA